MNTLRLFGGLWRESDSPVGAPIVGRGLQHQRLALLAMIALSPNRRVNRDQLLSLPWPEATSSEGRASGLGTRGPGAMGGSVARRAPHGKRGFGGG